MRHQRRGRSLGRDSAHRKALYANLTGSLVEHGRITTTLAKAKEVRPIAEKMVTLGKRGDLHARRQAISQVQRENRAVSQFTARTVGGDHGMTNSHEQGAGSGEQRKQRERGSLSRV